MNVGDTAPWCTSPTATVTGQYVEVNFTEPVVIAMLMSGGFVTSYVSNFNVYYSMSSTGDDFLPYGALKATQVCEELALKTNC